MPTDDPERQPAATWLTRWSEWRWILIWLGSGAALSAWGFLSLPTSVPDALYRTLQLFVLNFDLPADLSGRTPSIPAPLEAGRWMIATGVFFATIKAAWLALGDRLASFRLLIRPPDVLFCGLTETALRVAEGERRARLVALTAASLGGIADRFRAIGGLVVHGDPSVDGNLRRARAWRTRRCIYVLADDDRAGVQITRAACRHLAGSPAPGPVSVLTSLGDVEAERAGLVPAGQRTRLGWIDPPELAARVLLRTLPADHASQGGPRSDCLHALILGTTPVAEAVVLQLARSVCPVGPIRITVVSDDADVAGGRFLQRFPALAREHPDAALFPGILPLADLRFVGCSPATLAASRFEAWHREAPLTTAYVDLGDDHATRAACWRLRQLGERRGIGLPVVAYFAQEGPLPPGVSAVMAREVLRRHPDEAYLGERLDQTAMFVDYCFSEEDDPPSLEEPESRRAARRREALRRWAMRDEWQRRSARRAADHVPVKLRAIGQELPAHDADWSIETLRRLEREIAARLPELAALEHRRFCAERMLEGWLPVDECRWAQAPAGTQQRLRALRLNASLVAAAPPRERAKDERLVTCIPWVLQMLSRR